ncbi:uncharacterized protein LOC142242567 [Haematobia irritans]|uniref:uncharacterized protein LOC142242567 n=2 Tax=Haematobia irritans TaxID=7368 RepID=UPI003F4FF4BC
MELQEINMNNRDNQQQPQAEQRTNTTRSPPARSAFSEQQQRTTNAGLPRRRIKWTHEMNVSVMKAYYMSTRNESLTGYRQQMHNIFLMEYPELNHLTQQNLADRRSAIIRNNLIPPTILQEIQQSIIPEQPNDQPTHTQQKQQPTSETPDQPERDTQQTNIMSTHPNSTIINPNQEQEEIIPIIQSLFNEAKINYSEISPENRPFIGKRKPCKKMKYITHLVNTMILPTETTRNINYNQLITIMYCSAYTITQATDRHKRKNMTQDTNNTRTEITRLNRSSRTVTNSLPEQPRKPKWQVRLQQKIDQLRKDLGLITSHINNTTGKRSKNKINAVRHKHRIHTQYDPPNVTLEQIRDTIKQKLTKYTQRLRRYTKSHDRKTQNILFQTNEKQFYNSIAKPITTTTNQTPHTNMDDIEKFWRAIWSNGVHHDHSSTWINTVRDHASQNPEMQTTPITITTFENAIRKLHNWKQPGVDKIHNYYYKYLTTLHSHMLNIFNNMITNPQQITQEMCAGITYLKPKVEQPTTASQYRPITCLNTIYKIFTSCIAAKISEYCENNNIIAEEQKGCRQNTKGCKDQLIIDSVITNQAIRNRKNLYTAFIDYQKAFDSIPHSWLIEILRIYKIDNKLIDCIRCMMEHWQTTLHIRQGNVNTTSKPISITRGIYQGDSLSPLLFCLGLNPLSLLLVKSQYGYKLNSRDQHKISHCFYMDDLKLYASTKQNLKNMLKIVEIFSNDIKMQFGIDKCRTQNMSKGKYTQSHDFVTADGSHITPLESGEYYKYLGIKQHTTIDHTAEKRKTENNFISRVHKIGKSSLNGRNVIKAINTYAIPLLTYTFGILNWSNTDLINLDRKIRTTLSKTRHHHPKSSVERINIPRKQGGRGLLNIQSLHDKQIENLRQYFNRTANTSPLYRAVVNSDDNLTPLNLKNAPTTEVIRTNSLMEKWKSKPLHGKYPNLIHQEHIDIEKTNNWLLYSNMFSETEGFIIAIQDGVIPTKSYRKYIMHDSTITDDTCRRCGSNSETIPHILNSCPTLASTHYKQRHDNMGKIIHINILKQLNMNEETTHYYKYQPKPIIENQRYVIYWDRSILINNTTDTTMPNRPDMIIIDKNNKTANIIDFAVPYDTNIQETIVTKKSKYRQLSEYMRTSQELRKIEVIPIIVSSLGTIPRETTISMRKLNLHENLLTEIQKSVLIKATNIMRETLGEWM